MKTEDMSKCRLGVDTPATVHCARYSPSFGRECTHLVVCNESSPSTSRKLALALHNRRTWRTQIVTPSWVPACAAACRRLPEADFAALRLHAGQLHLRGLLAIVSIQQASAHGCTPVKMIAWRPISCFAGAGAVTREWHHSAGCNRAWAAAVPLCSGCMPQALQRAAQLKAGSRPSASEAPCTTGAVDPAACHWRACTGASTASQRWSQGYTTWVCSSPRS